MLAYIRTARCSSARYLEIAEPSCPYNGQTGRESAPELRSSETGHYPTPGMNRRGRKTRIESNRILRSPSPAGEKSHGAGAIRRKIFSAGNAWGAQPLLRRSGPGRKRPRLPCLERRYAEAAQAACVVAARIQSRIWAFLFSGLGKGTALSARSIEHLWRSSTNSAAP